MDSVNVFAEPVGNSGADGIVAAQDDATDGARPAPGMWMGPTRTPAIPMGDGRFRIVPVSEGRYRVRAMASTQNGSPSDSAPGEIVNVAKGSTVETTIFLDRWAAIRGHAVDKARQPVPDVQVSAVCGPGTGLSGATAFSAVAGGRILTDAEGRFVVDGLDEGASCTLRGEDSSGGVAVLKGARPGDEATLMIPSPGTLNGTAVKSGGDAVERFTLFMSDHETGLSRSADVSAIGGRWTLAGVAPGHWRIHARDSSGAVAQQQADLEGGQTLDGLKLEFHDETPRSRAVSNATLAP